MIITLKEIILNKDEPTKDPKAEAIQWLRKRKEKAMKPTIETMSTVGITATFPDGATISMTTTGLFPCSACDEAQCQHFHAALPHWSRFKWQMAEREDSPWGSRLLWAIGIRPPYIVRPNQFTKLTRWGPTIEGDEVAPGVRIWHTKHGKLYRFSGGEGHVYVGSDHPDGHTPCLICRDGCDHVRQALALEAQSCES